MEIYSLDIAPQIHAFIPFASLSVGIGMHAPRLYFFEIATVHNIYYGTTHVFTYGSDGESHTTRTMQKI